MRTVDPMIENEQVHRLSENLLAHLAKGREWATPGVQAAVQKAVVGLDTGIETASPRVQALLRRLAEELAGGVETLTPRVQEQLKRVGPKAVAPVPVRAGRPVPKTWWWICGLTALAGAGVAVWRSMQAHQEEPAPSLGTQKNSGADLNADADLTAGRM